MMTHDQIIEVVQAHKEGRLLEWNDNGIGGIGWTGFALGTSLTSVLKSIGNKRDIRINPTTKLRPMRSDEFPAVWWLIRQQNNYLLVVEQTEEYFCTHHVNAIQQIKFSDTMLKDRKWSPDRREIKSFFVEDTQ